MGRVMGSGSVFVARAVRGVAYRAVTAGDMRFQNQVMSGGLGWLLAGCRVARPGGQHGPEQSDGLGPGCQ